MRLSPTMYCLKQQVGEANRHATVAGAPPAGRAPCTFSDAEPDIAELKARISAAIDFVQGSPRAKGKIREDAERGSGGCSGPHRPLRHFGVFAQRIGIRASSGHLALQLLEPPASFAFAIIDKLDRSITIKRPGDQRT